MKAKNSYLDYFIDPSFQGVNRLFVLPFENVYKVYKTYIRQNVYKILSPKCANKRLQYHDRWQKSF